MNADQVKAHGELLEYHTTSVEIRGQNYDPDRGGSPDPGRVEDAMCNLIDGERRGRIQVIGAGIKRCVVRTQDWIKIAFYPRRHVSGIPHRELYVVDKDKAPIEDLWSLITAAFERYPGVAPYTAAARKFYQRSMRNRVVAIVPTHQDIMAFLEREVKNADNPKLRDAIETEINDIMMPVLDEYATHAKKLRRAKADALKAYHDEIRNGA